MENLSSSQKKDGVVWAFWIIVLGILIYGYSLNNGFLWDDGEYLMQNPLIHSLKGLVKFWDMSAGTPHPFPFTLSALWIEHKLWGFESWGYHTFSLTVHLLNALLLFGLLRRFAPSLAGITALLFTIHPIQVETVAWIAEQKNLLCLFFFLLAFHAFLDFDAKCKKIDHFKMLFFFTAALLSKCIAACFATVPLLYAWWRRGVISKRDGLRTLPLFALGAVSVLLPMQNENMDMPGGDLVLPERVLVAGKAFFFYIKQIVLPWQFLTLYPKWDVQITRPENWLFPLGAGALYFMLYRFRDRIGRGPFTLFCFYGISIFPALGFLNLALHQATYATDHFSYLSVPPILLFCCGAAQTLSAALNGPAMPGSLHVSSFFKRSLAGAIVLYLSLLSFCLTMNYGNPFILWTRLLQQDPRSSMAYNHLAAFMLENPRFFRTGQVIPLLKKAIELDPGNTGAYVDLGLCYERIKAYDKAVTVYGQALKRASAHSKSELYYYIGNACRYTGQLDKALDYLQKAADSYVSLTAHGQKRRAENIPYKKWLYNAMGDAYSQKKEFAKAARAYQKAMSLDPENPLNYQASGIALWNAGDTQKALRVYEEAYALFPQDKKIREDLNRMRELIEATGRKS